MKVSKVVKTVNELSKIRNRNRAAKTKAKNARTIVKTDAFVKRQAAKNALALDKQRTLRRISYANAAREALRPESGLASWNSVINQSGGTTQNSTVGSTIDTNTPDNTSKIR